ncbi:hypothetical protein MNBD_NITROSPINAE04-1756 [hydrothermal vent metagenome]|uniref:Lipocalin-like domain-containing protein n=1 Tax=hydrothermal vent metagenome TaxID=652676 RepID=A0A3B1C4E3_9ZZZZ
MRVRRKVRANRFVQSTIIAFLLLFMVACSGGDGDDAQSSASGGSWIGTWKAISAVLNGESAPTFNGVWELSDSSWTLTTVVCSASGTLTSSGNNLTLTVGSTTCPETTIPPEGRTATGTADVVGDMMTLTLSHVLEGVAYTLIMQCER